MHVTNQADIFSTLKKFNFKREAEILFYNDYPTFEIASPSKEGGLIYLWVEVDLPP
jgi:hypothetical protein